MDARKINMTPCLYSPRRMAMAGAILLLAAGALVFFSTRSQAGWGKGGSVSAAIQPGDIQLGEAAVLVVQVSGEQSAPPALSAVDGLRFYSMGRSSQYQSINGRVSATTSYLFQVQAEHAGEFVIPPIQADIDGRILKSEAVTLRVTRGATRHSRGGALPSSPPNSQPQVLNQAKTQNGQLMSWEEGKPAFLRVLPRDSRAYVGELLPMEIKAYFHQGVQATLRSLPTFAGGAFACRELKEKPQQTEEILNGIPYNVLTWYTAMSAVKEGEHEVSAALDAVLGIPEQSRRRSLFGRGLFDDDFFNGFSQNIREEAITLTNPRLKIRILPLPKMDRPKDFTGAVGQFKLSASATPDRAMVGDPITVKMTVKGSGNFDRVSTPVLNVSSKWKTYRPTTSFKPQNSAGYSGEKSFEQAIIPMNEAIKSIPGVTFSYFDTDQEKYVTLQTESIPLTLIPGQRADETPTSAKTETKPPESGKSVVTGGNNPAGSHLAPIHVAMGPTVKSLRPLIENPWFLGAQGFPLGALFLGFFFSRRQKKRLNDPGLIRKKQVKQKVSQSIKKMDRAITAHDVPEFFNACRAAAQERLGNIWGQTPESITLAEIKERLGGNGEDMVTVFEKADAATYSGQSFRPDELQKFRDLVIRALKDLDNSRPSSRNQGLGNPCSGR